MLFFILLSPLLILAVLLLIHFVIKTFQEDTLPVLTTSSSHVESKSKKSPNYLDLDNLDNVDDFSLLVYKYTKELVETYGKVISTRQVINSLHTVLEEIVIHLNQVHRFSFRKYYNESQYYSLRKPTDVFFKNDHENISTYRYHVLNELVPLLFLKEDSLNIDKIKTYFINSNSDAYYLWDKLTESCDSDNGFNDRYSSASIYCALAIVLAIRHVIQNRMKENKLELLDDHLTALEIELDIAKAPKVCNNIVYCPEDGIQINSQTISKILNIFKRD